VPALPRFAALLLVFCVALPATAVVNGDVDPNTLESPWAGVGSLSVNGGTFTATLVAPDLVLTAAHVLGSAAPQDVTFNLNVGGDLTQRIPAAEVIIHPAYRGFHGARPGGEYDLALVRLVAPVSALVPIYAVFEGDVPRGAVIAFVGYGAAGDGIGGATIGGNPAVKRVGQNVAECFAWTLEADTCGLPALTGLGPRALYLFDFDPPGAPSALPGGEATLAGGDSGSPAFVRVGGAWQLAGVNTFVTTLKGKPAGVYGTAGGGVLLTLDVRLWIRSHMPPPPPASTPFGVPGDKRARDVPAGVRYALLALGAGLVAHALWKRARPVPPEDYDGSV
jgi:hypothetical protein